jgi:hypothetical protein
VPRSSGCTMVKKILVIVTCAMSGETILEPFEVDLTDSAIVVLNILHKMTGVSVRNQVLLVEGEPMPRDAMLMDFAVLPAWFLLEDLVANSKNYVTRNLCLVMLIVPQTCAWCKKSATNMLMCACKQISYCSLGCQSDHWPEHRPCIVQQRCGFCQMSSVGMMIKCPCDRIVYCNPRCQRNHWQVHKKKHKQEKRCE